VVVGVGGEQAIPGDQLGGGGVDLYSTTYG